MQTHHYQITIRQLRKNLVKWHGEHECWIYPVFCIPTQARGCSLMLSGAPAGLAHNLWQQEQAEQERHRDTNRWCAFTAFFVIQDWQNKQKKKIKRGLKCHAHVNAQVYVKAYTRYPVIHLNQGLTANKTAGQFRRMQKLHLFKVADYFTHMNGNKQSLKETGTCSLSPINSGKQNHITLTREPEYTKHYVNCPEEWLPLVFLKL